MAPLHNVSQLPGVGYFSATEMLLIGGLLVDEAAKWG